MGSEAASYNNILTSGLQSLWLAHLLTGATRLPDEVAMQARWGLGLRAQRAHPLVAPALFTGATRTPEGGALKLNPRVLSPDRMRRRTSPRRGGGGGRRCRTTPAAPAP